MGEKYDGSRESLQDKSHKPLTLHPSAHTEQEIKWIKDIIKRNPHATLTEIWYKLSRQKGYKGKPTSLYRILRKLGYYKYDVIAGTSKRVSKPYDTPKNLGKKWQIDVTFMPKECKENLPMDKNYYQFT